MVHGWPGSDTFASAQILSPSPFQALSSLLTAPLGFHLSLSPAGSCGPESALTSAAAQPSTRRHTASAAHTVSHSPARVRRGALPLWYRALHSCSKDVTQTTVIHRLHWAGRSPCKTAHHVCHTGASACGGSQFPAWWTSCQVGICDTEPKHRLESRSVLCGPALQSHPIASAYSLGDTSQPCQVQEGTAQVNTGSSTHWGHTGAAHYT